MTCFILNVFGIMMTLAGIELLHPPHISIQVFSGYAIQLSCDHYHSRTEVTRIYRNSSKGFDSIVKVLHREDQCNLSTDLPADIVQCNCVQGRRVVCNISDSIITRRDGQWKCAIVVNNTFVFSNVAHISQGMESTKATALGTTIITEINVDYRGENGTEETSIRNDSFFGTFTILTAAGVVLLLSAALLICVYRKCQIRTEAISPPMAENVSIVRTTTHELLFEGVTARQRSPSHHHEQIPMMEISPLADRFPLSNEEIIVEHTMDAEAEQENVIHYYTITDSPDADVPVYQNENLESQPQRSETVRYENLLPKRPDETTPYSSLANI